jgi:general nucleoside transport system ATP-binding protein
MGNDIKSIDFSERVLCEENPRVKMQSICKRFGEVQALDNASLSLAKGEVHALLGENGAGKTTLMNVLSGLYVADSGEIVIDGKKVDIRRPKDAADLGIGMVHQHFELISNFTALENIILAAEGGRPVIDMNSKRKELEELMPRYGLFVDLDSKVRDMAIGVQQKVEIIKALYRGVSILILDEPTTMLTPQEADCLFTIIGSFTQQGLTVILITHKIKEVLKISNRITVMRRGRSIQTVQTSEASEKLLVEIMMGDRSSYNGFSKAEKRKTEKIEGGEVLSVEELTIGEENQPNLVENVSIKVNRGEIVGLVGVSGNGQREVAEAIYGVRVANKGKIAICGQKVTGGSVIDSLRAGVYFIPEDRIHLGILPNLSLSETLILGPHHFLFKDSIMLDFKRTYELGREAIQEYQIKAPNERSATCLLSGGNIQKTIIARACLFSSITDLNLLIAFNPTNGLDVMSTQFVHDKLLEISSSGRGILLVSEDLDESMLLCNRIYVLHKGRVAGELARADFDPYVMGAMMSGGEVECIN